MARSSSERWLAPAFFDRPTLEVARDLLGATVQVRGPGGPRATELVEVEAYGPADPASHAYRGPTRRNRTMYGPPGGVYVYRIHQVVCANLVTRRGEAVLLRAGTPVGPERTSASGPGRLCRALGLTFADDGTRVSRTGRFSVRAAPDRLDQAIVASPRVGISRAIDRPWRFSVAGSPWVSRPGPRLT